MGYNKIDKVVLSNEFARIKKLALSLNVSEQYNVLSSFYEELDIENEVDKFKRLCDNGDKKRKRLKSFLKKLDNGQSVFYNFVECKNVKFGFLISFLGISLGKDTELFCCFFKLRDNFDYSAKV